MRMNLKGKNLLFHMSYEVVLSDILESLHVKNVTILFELHLILFSSAFHEI